MLIAERDDEIAQQHDQHVRNEGGQSHLGFTDPTIPLCRAGGNPIAQGPVGGEANGRTDEDGEIREPDRLAGHVVRRGGEVLRLCQVDGQEG